MSSTPNISMGPESTSTSKAAEIELESGMAGSTRLPARPHPDEEGEKDVIQTVIVDVDSVEPCEDIKTAIDECLEECSDFQGSHFYAQTFSETPNPGLRLLPESDLGPIGLPLNEHEAHRIWSRCLGNETFNTAAGFLEIPASHVRLDNPAWEAFLEGVRQQVCKTLGAVDGGIYSPRLKLASLVLQGPGPRQNTDEIAVPSFGSLLITLPSPHIGGIAQITYGPAIHLYDPSPASYLAASVLGWYSASPDVLIQEVVPISVGLRLSLRYSLNHVDPAKAIPCLPSPTSQVQNLKEVLISWKNQGWAGLQKIVYLLSEDYDVERLSKVRPGGLLTNTGDLRKVEFMDAVARKCGFNVGLATIETVEEGTPDYMGNYDDWDEDGDCLYEPSYWDDEMPGTPEPTPSEYTMGDVQSQGSSCTVLVDVRTGEVIAEDLEEIIDGIEGHVPENLLEDLDAHTRRDEEYGGWEGNGSGSLKRIHRATVMVIWPSFRHHELVEGREYVAGQAMARLEETDHSHPTQEDLDHFEFLLEYASYEKRWSTDPRILSVLSAAALRWDNKLLFERAIAKCHAEEKIKRLGTKGILDAVTKLGIEYMKPLIERILQNDPSNLERFKLAGSLWDFFIADAPALRTWVDELERGIVENLAPIQKPDIDPLFAYLRKHADLSTFARTIMKLVNKFTPADALFDLAALLHQETKSLSRTAFLKLPQEMELAVRLSGQILSLAICNGDYFENLKSQPIALSQEKLDLALHHINMCLDMGCDHAVERVLQKLSPDRFSKKQPRSTREIAQYASSLIPHLPQLQPALSNSDNGETTLLPGAAAFYRSLAAWYAKGMEYCGTNGPNTAELLKIVQLTLDIDSLGSLEESVVPAIVKHVRNDTSIKALLRHLHSRRYVIATSPQATQTLVKMMGDLLEAMIGRNILDRIRQEMPKMDKSTLSNVVLPLVSELWKRVESRRIDRSGVEARPLVIHTGQIIGTWSERALGYAEVASVATELRRCSRSGCRSCGLLAQLLPLRLERDEVKLRGLGMTEGRHVDQQLRKSRAVLICNWSLPSGRGGDFSLRMQDGYYMTSLRWKGMRDGYLQVLKRVGGGDTLWQQLLGPQGYHLLLQRLDVTSIHPRPTLGLSSRPNAGPSAPETKAAGKRPYSQTQAGSQPVPQTPRPNAPAAKRPRLANENIVIIDLTSP
ncbi:hypothetical protein FRB90_003746 [Tulasnella sp. 427]|nr:hypothetical protein FRB90_003746 [Tulasnella sp. 427]